MVRNELSKQDEAIELLKALKGAGISYKNFATVANIKVKSLYSWIERKSFTDEKADFIIKAVEYYFPFHYSMIKANKMIQDALQGGDMVLENGDSSDLLNLPPLNQGGKI